MRLKKKFMLIVLATVFAKLSFMPATIQASQVHVTIDGRQVNFTDQGPTIVDGRTLVPVRGVFEELGFEVDWEQDTETARLTRSGHEVVLTIGSINFITNGESHTLDVPAQIIGGRTMLPIRAVLESVGYSVDWSQATNTVLISSSSGQGTYENRFNHSTGINENGFWEGVTALDYVEIFDYNNLEIPEDAHYVSDRQVEAEIRNLLLQCPSRNSDRTVIKSDSVNIDYVGSIDGVIFESEEDVNISFGFIDITDEFFKQLIGHKPGDTVHVEMTFPDDDIEELAGKDALFAITINFIIRDGQSRLTDTLVLENFYDLYGWTTVREMRVGVYWKLLRSAIVAFVDDYIMNEVNVSSIPKQLNHNRGQSIINSLERDAIQLGITLDEYLEILEFDIMLLELNRETNIRLARRELVFQAIAEHGGFSVSREEVRDFFVERFGISDYSSFKEEVGLPYIMKFILHEKILNHIVENAVLL